MALFGSREKSIRKESYPILELATKKFEIQVLGE